MPKSYKGKPRSKTASSSSVNQSLGKTPPHSLEMERALLCSILIDPNAFGRVLDIVDEGSFYDRRHQLIFAAVSRLYQNSAPVDALTVSDELERNEALEPSGGHGYIASLTNEVATSTHAEHYAGIVQEKAILRNLISTSSLLSQRAYENEPPKDLLEDAMKNLMELHTKGHRGGFKPISDVLNTTGEYLDKRFHKADSELTGIGTGFRELDQLTSGFQRGDLIIVAARPSMGKTAFSLDLARHACIKHNVPVGFFSLEMSAMQIALRLLASTADIDLHRLRSGKINNLEIQRMTKALVSLSESSFFVDDTGTLGLMELRARARQMKMQHNVGIIFIDYLQLMKPPRADSREQEVSQISRALKGLARELEVPVVALSQLSRAVEHRGGDKRPQLSDLRDSGSIEQDADVVMFIFREKHYKTEDKDNDPQDDDSTSEIIVRKQRNGPTGTIRLTFVDAYTSFRDQADPATVALVEKAGTYNSSMEDDAPF